MSLEFEDMGSPFKPAACPHFGIDLLRNQHWLRIPGGTQGGAYWPNSGDFAGSERGDDKVSGVSEMCLHLLGVFAPSEFDIVTWRPR